MSLQYIMLCRERSYLIQNPVGTEAPREMDVSGEARSPFSAASFHGGTNFNPRVSGDASLALQAIWHFES